MAIIYTNQKSKPKKKPGWKKEQEEYDKWLASHGVQPKQKRSSTATKTGSKSKVSISSPLEVAVKQRLEAEKVARTQHQSRVTAQPVPVKVHDPKLLYKDNPEMLERELAARERKFAVAPAFNKGGDQLVTPDMMKDIMNGGGRRRS